ncbi:MAG: S-methyl-5-thioribose-1-phosphate isomerase, partial [Proteobacteria bacterium]|nr:S-methyl-5-thioribose-1-phosphate isomerase [Pseudomonadota bacterium]
LPSPTIDWTIENGRDIPIEERSATEVTKIQGRTASGEVVSVEIVPDGAKAGNPAFDVTPARLVSGLITERGVSKATKTGLKKMFPERAR